jgi:hypothetical protein
VTRATTFRFKFRAVRRYRPPAFFPWILFFALSFFPFAIPPFSEYLQLATAADPRFGRQNDTHTQRITIKKIQTKQ